MTLKHTKARPISNCTRLSIYHRLRGGLAALFAVLSFPLAAGAAPAVPQPGEEIRQPVEQGKTEISNDLPEGRETKGESTRFTLTGIRVEHEGMKLSEEGLSALTSPLLGREITASELNAAVEQLTQYARKNYPAAIAYIPEQTAREGKLLIRFEPGRFDKVQIEAGSVLKESVAHRPLAGLKKGRIIEAGSLEESLRNLRDIPGIAAHATLSPGSEQGTSNLTIKVTDLHPATYILYGENYGSKSAGRYRYGASRQTGRISAAPAAA
ncbi:MAG: ShlB/FhaC/HecB family hemolysin secretion/activation protein [Selenomonas sp.]|nr:ShlB/FhaC/HecB family hemolysin secretion/activation protein [Selenomonas sp.]